LAEAVYGIPEFAAPAIAKARAGFQPRLLPDLGDSWRLLPLLKAGWVDVHAGVIADSKSGVTGAGRKPSDKLHFSRGQREPAAYGLFRHRHLPEMLQELELAAEDSFFTPHLLPSRGES